MAALEGGAHSGALIAVIIIVLLAAAAVVFGMWLGLTTGAPAAHDALRPTNEALAVVGGGAFGGGAFGGGVMAGGVMALRGLRGPLFDAIDRLSNEKAVRYAAVARSGVAPASDEVMPLAPVGVPAIAPVTPLADDPVLVDPARN